MSDDKRNFLIMNGIDVVSGIVNTMDEETYNEVLLEFYDELLLDIDKMKSFKELNDMSNYGIVAHALKSNCRMLGFTNLGEMFYLHEIAGKNNDNNYVNVHYDELMLNVENVINILKKYKEM